MKYVAGTISDFIIGEIKALQDDPQNQAREMRVILPSLPSRVILRIGKAIEEYRLNQAGDGNAIKLIYKSAYSLGEEGLEDGSSLSTRLQRDPAWNPLVAFTLVLFVMLYVPCFVTLVCIAKETSWLWAGFSACFNLATAFIISFIVYQTGLALGIGV